jgi:hypothetical protein
MAAVAAGCAVLLASGGATAEGCKTLSGKFTLASVTGPECTSPVGICAAGTFSGGLKGTSLFVGSSLTATAERRPPESCC